MGWLKAWRPWAMCLLLLFIWSNQIATAAAAEISLTNYWILVAESQEITSNAAVTNSQLAQLGQRWQAVTAVVLDDGTVMLLDTTVISAALQSEPPDREALAAHFEAILRGRANWSAAHWTTATATTATTQLAEILQGEEFQEAQPSALRQAWERLWERVDEFFRRLWPQREGEGVLANDAFTFALATVAAVLLLIVIGLIARALVSDFVAEAEFAAELHAGGEPLTSAKALQQAHQLSEGGDYRTAVRYLYLSCLLTLEERNLLRYDRSLTNREYLRSVAHRPEIFTLLRDIVDVFDRVWYGFMPIDAETYRQYAVRVETLQKQRPRAS